MEVREFLLSVLSTYDRDAPMNSPAQRLLRSADKHIGRHVPAGIMIKGSGGQGRTTFTPWVALLDPDETTSSERGLYVVYIFDPELGRVSLSLMQGMTEVLQRTRELERPASAARATLRSIADGIRMALPESLVDRWDDRLDLGQGGWRQQAYVAGNVAAVRYEKSTMPSERQLRDDLWAILALYQRALIVKRQTSGYGLFPPSGNGVSPPEPERQVDPLQDFKPKNSADYLAYLRGRVLKKERRHERLIEEFGNFAADRGYVVSTKVHPRDLVLRRNGKEWLVEAKVVYVGNVTDAVRAAVGQLFSYRHFWYAEPPSPRLLAIFTDDIGTAYSDFLETLEIAALWKTADGWRGSTGAETMGLTDETPT